MYGNYRKNAIGSKLVGGFFGVANHQENYKLPMDSILASPVYSS
jgi:hypothetical protein